MGYFAYLRSSSDFNFAALSTAVLTASTEASGYDVDDVNDLPIAKPWRSTGITSEYIALDLLTAKLINFVAVVNHNITSAATVTLKAGTTSAVSDFSVTIPWAEFDMYKLLSSSELYRYWRIQIVDTSNPDGYISIGYLMLGILTQLTFGFDNNWEENYEGNNLADESEYGVVSIEKLFRRRGWQMEWNDLLDVDATSLVENFLHKLCGNAEPIFVVPDVGLTTKGFMVRSQGKTRKIHRSWRQSSVAVEFREEARGVRVSS